MPSRQAREPRRQTEATALRQRALLEEVFSALRPPDGVEDGVHAEAGVHNFTRR